MKSALPEESTHRRRRHPAVARISLAVVVAGVLASVAALMAACGGSSSGSSTATSTPGSGQASGLQAYLSCLSKNGVTIQLPSGRPSGGRPTGFPSGGAFPTDLPSGGPGAGFGGGFGGGGGLQKPAGVDDATWQKAQQACASARPSGGPGGGNGQNTALRAYRDCLTNHGVTASTGQLNSDDPTVAAAQKACAALLPTAAPTAGNS